MHLRTDRWLATDDAALKYFLSGKQVSIALMRGIAALKGFVVYASLFLVCLLVSILLAGTSMAEEFMLGEYRALALIGEAKLVDGTEYLSFAGDFGFAGWVPTADAVQRYLNHEALLLSTFSLSVINLEHGLPGFSGRELDSQIDAVAVGLLKQAGFDVISLANNHALDYGPEGVRYNTEQLPKAGLATIGTPISPAYEWETGGRRVAIYALTDATDHDDQDRLVLHLDEPELGRLSQKTARADFRIAFVHLGSMSFFPSPHERKQVARLIDAGADLVVCTGSHFIKGFVTERGKPVVYGIGNHLFRSSRRDTEPIGMHLVAGFRAGELVQLFVVPFRNMILEGDIGPLDEPAFHAFKDTLLERSSTDTSRYFSDPHSLTKVKERLNNFSLARLQQIRPRHLVYALFVAFQHYPLFVIAGGLIILILPVLLMRRLVLSGSPYHRV